jgi:curved DNA-binding protein CbpA
LLIAKADYSANPESSGGVNCSEKLNAALKILRDDPYLAIGVETGAEATESEIKKSYRKFALKFHPDKTQNKTGLLFTVIQTAYGTLSDEEKRKALDARMKKQQVKLEKMRAAKEASEKRKAEKENKEDGGKQESNLKPPPVSTNSFRQPPQSKDEASYRAFNKKFFSEFRKKNHPPTDRPKDKPPPPTAAHPPSSSSNPPKRRNNNSKGAKVRLKPTHRSDSTVTLTWSLSGAKDDDSTAYELQWRVHGLDPEKEWETSPQLILGHSCRKKNLTPGTCYAFRVRAATANGWTPYCEPVMVVTNNNHSQPARPASASASRSTKDESKKKAPPSKDMFKQNFSSADAWLCSICKRPNGPDAPQCTICYTRRSYIGKTSEQGQKKKAPNTARPSTAGNVRSSDRGYSSEGCNRTPAADSEEE